MSGRPSGNQPATSQTYRKNDYLPAPRAWSLGFDRRILDDHQLAAVAGTCRLRSLDQRKQAADAKRTRKADDFGG